MSNFSIKHEIKHFFDAPGDSTAHTRSEVKKGTCAQREVCLMNGLILEPGVGLSKASGFGYAGFRAVVLAVYQLFRAVACKKGACKKVGDYSWMAIQGFLAVPVIFASTLIKIIRSVLGAVIHPVIAAKKDSEVDEDKNERRLETKNDRRVDRKKTQVTSESSTKDNPYSSRRFDPANSNAFGNPPIIISGSGTGDNASGHTPVVISGSGTGGVDALRKAPSANKAPVMVSESATGSHHAVGNQPVVVSQSSTTDQANNTLPETFTDEEGNLKEAHPKTTMFLSEDQQPFVVTEPKKPTATREGALT